MSYGLREKLGKKCQNKLIGVAHLLAQEITDFDGLAALLNDAVDGEMGVYCSHLVLEALEAKLELVQKA